PDRHPPIVPSFPYPTLFRSREGSRPAGLSSRTLRSGRGTRGRWYPRCPPRVGRFSTRVSRPRLPPELAVAPRALVEATPNPHARNRKSTRLNSSHVKISYAV